MLSARVRYFGCVATWSRIAESGGAFFEAVLVVESVLGANGVATTLLATAAACVTWPLEESLAFAGEGSFEAAASRVDPHPASRLNVAMAILAGVVIDRDVSAMAAPDGLPEQVDATRRRQRKAAETAWSPPLT